MATEIIAAKPDSAASLNPPARAARVTSIDALRGVVMFTMIFVNDLSGVSDNIVPLWMKHFRGENGMTFVDLVFPAFMFIVGMSIPLALGPRLNRGEPLWRILLHIIARTLSLMLVGILMVNGTPDTDKMGWSGTLWCCLMYLSAIMAFCTLTPPRKPDHPQLSASITFILRAVGLVLLIWLAFAFRGKDGHTIVMLSPFSIHKIWYGILGTIGWVYLVSAIVFLIFRTNRTALLGCMALLMCLYAAEKKGAFNGFWLSHYVNIGGVLGSRSAIAVSGILLACILVNRDTATVWSRVCFTLWFIAGCAAAAMLTYRLYGINKSDATPSWCLWSAAITAALWLGFYYVCDVRSITAVSRPLAIAGQNVFLAYLISELVPSAFEYLHFDGLYSALAQPTVFNAVARSTGCAFVIICFSAMLNRLGFRLKL